METLMLNKLRQSTLIFVGILLGLSLAIGHSVYALKDDQVRTLDIPFESLQAFTDVFSKVKSDYVEGVDDKKLIEDAIRGMLSGLDPHSAFMNTAEFNELKVGTTGQFGGLGIEVSMENGFVKVISPIDGTPASRAGLQPSDLIIQLDETPVKGMTLNDAVKIMRGEPDTDILLTIVREGESAPLEFTITREIIRVKSVKSKMLEDGYGYVRIASFQSRTTTDLLKTITDLQKETPLKGMVLDLRNNPGGVLSGAIGVSNAFINDGLVVYTEGRIADSSHRYNATPGDSLNGAPLIILINGGSASASEIVAGAMQDHKRAIIMGTKSFGKGSVQTIQELQNGSAVKITTARYFTPNGRSIQAKGIVPDIELKTLRLPASDDKQRKSYSENDLSGHLSNPDDDKKTDAAKNKPDTDKVKSLSETDFQLYEALNLLKGMNILSQMGQN
jgi:carboxyl-terminal processing protease|tara:strand:+ start:2037 stop:3374 length:1338 start_codon:yes stop_codon:yes gene_type:complete